MIIYNVLLLLLLLLLGIRGRVPISSDTRVNCTAAVLGIYRGRGIRQRGVFE